MTTNQELTEDDFVQCCDQNLDRINDNKVNVKNVRYSCECTFCLMNL